MPNAELLWCEIPNVSRPSGQQLPILNRTHRSGYCHVFKLEKERLGWVYAKKVYFHQYKSQNIETLIARITENTEIYLAVVLFGVMRDVQHMKLNS